MRAPPRPSMAFLALGVVAAALLACGSSAPEGSELTEPTRPPKSDCASCHLAEYASARDHAGQKPTTCFVCHTSEAWHPIGLHHGWWPLTGAHEKTRCFDCHEGVPAVFEKTPRDCDGCHHAQYDKAPDHVAKHFPTTCQDCHSAMKWKPTLPHAVPAPAPSASASAGGDDAGTETAPSSFPAASHAPRPPPRPPRPKPPPPQPTVEPTTNASKRL